MKAPKLPDPVKAPYPSEAPRMSATTGATPARGIFSAPMFSTLTAQRSGGRRSLIGGG